MIQPARTMEEKSAVLAYLASKIGSTPEGLVGHMPFEATWTLLNGQPRGALLYTNYRVGSNSIEMSAAGESGWLTMKVIKAMFGYPFRQLDCWNLLIMIKRNNTISREISKRLGFTELCVIECGSGKINDTILYSMTRDKCRWIETKAKSVSKMNGASHHGQECTKSA